MSMTDDATQALPSAHPRTRRRVTRLTAAAVTVGVTVAAIVTSGGGTAAAATPLSQSVGRFLDGSIGGNAIQQLADVVDARAKAAPNTTVRNPLEAKVLSALDVPLGNALQLPGAGALSLGVANQIAQAKTDGSSYGASGAVSNTGGVDLTDDQGAFPSDAKINLSSDLLGSVSIPGLPTTGLPTLPTGGLPTGTSLAALGGLTADVGAVQALAQTLKGGAISAPQSKVATVTLNLGSPALGGLLQQLKALLSSSVLSGLTGSLNTIIGNLTTLPASCSLTAGTIPDNIYLDSTGKTATKANSAVTIDVANATISVNLGALIQKLLGTDITNLKVSNFDLIKFLVQNLPTILSTGLTSVVTGITDPLKAQLNSCVDALGKQGGLGGVLAGVIDSLTGPNGVLTKGQTTLTDLITQLSAPFKTTGASALAPLATALGEVADIGLNVQSGPVVQPREKTYTYTTGLKATPDQATPVVKGQSLVRAIEIDLLDTSGLSGGGALGGLPGLPTTAAAVQHHGAATNAVLTSASPAISLALGNAAAGPSSTAPAPPTTSAPPTTNVPTTSIPTGVPAGAAGHRDNGSPLGPIALIAVGLVAAAGTVFTLRQRGRFSR